MLKHIHITHFYQFLAEAIIIFLLINPFTYGYYATSHYLGYILIAIIVGACFYLLEKYNRSIGYFLLILPLSALLFYVFEFPIGLVILFPLVFLWRFGGIRSYKNPAQEEIHLHMLDQQYNREMFYLHATIIIGVFDAVYTGQIFVMYYVFLQFMILLAGNLLSHVLLLKKEERKKINFNTFFSIPILMIIGAVIVFFVFDPFRQLVNQMWLGFQSLAISALGGLAWLIGFILPDIERPSMTEEQKDFMIEQQQQDNDPNPFAGIEDEPGIDELTMVIVVTSILIAIVIFFIVRHFKNKREQLTVEADHTVTYHTLDRKEKEKTGFFQRIFSRSARKPTHLVRELVYRFERQAVQNELGRHPFESIDEWVNRLQVDVNTEIYEKVRYGNLEVNQEEIAQLESQLKAIDLKEIKVMLDNKTSQEMK